jgi:CMP-N-acetylneuraminic acid synthetase
MTYDGLMKSGIRLSGLVRPYVMPEERTINIDEPIDLNLAKLMLESRNNDK